MRIIPPHLHLTMTALQNQIRKTARTAILNALTDGDPIDTAKTLREEIRQAWHFALDEAGVPEDQQAKLKFPI